MTLIAPIIAQLATESSTNKKLEILKANADNELLRLYFKSTLDPFTNYFIRVKDIPDVVGQYNLTEGRIHTIVSTLSNRVLTGHSARDFLFAQLTDLNKEDQILLKNMINHDANCKVAAGLVNKVWDNLIPSFPVMLAEDFNEKNAKRIKEGKDKIIVQTKEDGGRVEIVVSEKGDVTVYSRSGNILELHGALDSVFSQYPGQVFDGELLVISNDGVHDRKTGNGIFNQAVRGTISKENAEKVVVVLWDQISSNKWHAGYDPTPYRTRFNTLNMTYESMSKDKVRIVKSKTVSTHEECFDFYQERLSEKLEGAMVKDADGPWEDRRSYYVLKMKEVKQATLKCVGVTPHSKYPNLIGSLECESADGLLQVSIGSGLTQEDRERDPSYFVGSLIEMFFNALITKRGSDTISMFLPRYDYVRTDRTEADTLEHIKGQ